MGDERVAYEPDKLERCSKAKSGREKKDLHKQTLDSLRCDISRKGAWKRDRRNVIESRTKTGLTSASKTGRKNDTKLKPLLA
jgi:hypothetical protein